MFINDLLLESDTIEKNPDGYASEEDDQSILKLSDMRKTRLTLSQLNKLRIMNDVKRLEHEQKIKNAAKQYKPAEQDTGGM